MPPVDKALRRDRKREKARESKFMGVRYNNMRAGQGLVSFEAERKTTFEGKPAKSAKKKK